MSESNEEPLSNKSFIFYLQQQLGNLEQLKVGLQEKKLSADFVMSQIRKTLRNLKNENILKQEKTILALLRNWKDKIDKGAKFIDLINEANEVLITDAVRFLTEISGHSEAEVRQWIDDPNNFTPDKIKFDFASMTEEKSRQQEEQQVKLQAKLDSLNVRTHESVLSLQDAISILQGLEQISFYEKKVALELVYTRVMPFVLRVVYYYLGFYISLKLNLLEPIFINAKFSSKDNIQLLLFIIGLILVDLVLGELILAPLKRIFLFRSITNCIKITNVKIDAFNKLGPFLP